MHFVAGPNCKKYLIPVWGMAFCAVKKCRATYPINKKNAPKGAFSKTLLRVFYSLKLERRNNFAIRVSFCNPVTNFLALQGFHQRHDARVFFISLFYGDDVHIR